MPETPKNDSDLLRMQQEAIRRVRIMQQRAQKSVEPEPHSEPVPQHDPPAPPAAPQRPPEPANTRTGGGRSAQEAARTAHTPRAEPQQSRHYAARPWQNPLAALFSRTDRKGTEGESFLSSLFDGDSERTMLLILLVILLDDETDTSLILALLYLIL